MIAFNSDPVTEHLHQPMRIPGFFRKEKNAYQELLFYSAKRYSFDELQKGFQNWFKFNGWKFPGTISDQWWSEVFYQILCSGSGLDVKGKVQAITAALDKGADAYIQRRKRESEQKKAERDNRRERCNGSAGGNLMEAVSNAVSLADSDDFTGD